MRLPIYVQCINCALLVYMRVFSIHVLAKYHNVVMSEKGIDKEAVVYGSVRMRSWLGRKGGGGENHAWHLHFLCVCSACRQDRNLMVNFVCVRAREGMDVAHDGKKDKAMIELPRANGAMRGSLVTYYVC